MVLPSGACGPVPRQPRGCRKKLIAWARWRSGAGPGTDNGERLWDVHGQFGDDFTSAYCRQCKAVCPDCPQPRLLPDAMPAAAVYLSCFDTQWRHAPSGVRTGLCYDAGLAMLDRQAPALGVDGLDRAELLALVQVVERASIAADIEVLKRERKPDGDA